MFIGVRADTVNYLTTLGAKKALNCPRKIGHNLYSKNLASTEAEADTSNTGLGSKISP